MTKSRIETDGGEEPTTPMSYRLEMFYDEDGPKDEIEILAAFISEHTAARGADAYAVDYKEHSAAEWAEMTGRDRSTVARNVRRARREE